MLSNSHKKIQAVAVLFHTADELIATLTRYELIQKSSTIQRVGATSHGGHTSVGANVQYVQYDRNALTCSCFAQAPAKVGINFQTPTLRACAWKFPTNCQCAAVYLDLGKSDFQISLVELSINSSQEAGTKYYVRYST